MAELQGREFRLGTSEFGQAFEAYLLHELVSHRDYTSGDPLSHWRSRSGFEVHFLMGDHTALEVKAKPNVSAQDMKSLRAVAEENVFKRYDITDEKDIREAINRLEHGQF